MTPTTPVLLVIGATMAVFGLAACATAPVIPSPSDGSTTPTSTSATVSATPTITATPTPTFDADQAAAVDVVERYSEAMAKIRADPRKYDQYKMIEVLKPLAFDDMIQANLNGVRPWRDKGWHAEGSVVTVSASASKPSEISGGSRQVVVTVCRDQRGLEVVDKKGNRVSAKAAEFPDFLQNTYDMRTVSSGQFKLWQLAGKTVGGCTS